MSCCSKGYCSFKFPEGPPLLDYSVKNLNARYQFLPYGSLLEKGEVVRIWMESGKTQTVIVEDKISLYPCAEGFADDTGRVMNDYPWQLIAFDSGFEFDDMMAWQNHPLNNPDVQPVLMVYQHPIEVKPSLKEKLYAWLYKFRNL